MRQLASVQRIKSLTPIEGADFIEMARVLDWNVVVQKELYKEGDLCVYVEIDSLLPSIPEFFFLANSKGKIPKIKTKKLRGRYSQGICFPVSILEGIIPNGSHWEYKERERIWWDSSMPWLKEDLDITDRMNIKKWEFQIPACLMGKVLGGRPEFVPKTDETRVQILGRIIEKYQGTVFYVTEKLDGSSMSIFYNEGDMGVCSRNINLDMTDQNNAFIKYFYQNNIKGKLEALNQNIVIQGELCGEGIQNNKYKLEGHHLFVYQIFNLDTYKYLDFKDFIELVDRLEMKTVPVLDTEFILNHTVDSLVDYSIGKSVFKGEREGVVLRPLVEMEGGSEKLHRNRLSFKVINPKFLVKYGE